MQVEIDDKIIKRVQEYLPVQLKSADKDFFADWLAGIGLATVDAALRQNPGMTFGDLFMLSLRNFRY